MRKLLTSLRHNLICHHLFMYDELLFNTLDSVYWQSFKVADVTNKIAEYLIKSLLCQKMSKKFTLCSGFSIKTISVFVEQTLTSSPNTLDE